jgi:hypothetical protein
VNPTAHSDRETRVLSLWEGAVGRPRRDRDEALLADSGHPRGLGARNRALIALRTALFGRDWSLQSECPACGVECEFAVDTIALVEELSRMTPPEDDGVADWNGRAILLRAPTADDLYGIDTGEGDAGSVVRALVARCMATDVEPAALSDDETDRLGRLIERLDPAAMISFALECPECRGGWSAPIDVAAALWAEVQRSAERLLTEIGTLAAAYGWSEEQVVRLSPVRRAAYLQLAGRP